VGSQGFEALAVEALRTLKQSQEDASAALRSDLDRIRCGRASSGSPRSSAKTRSCASGWTRFETAVVVATAGVITRAHALVRKSDRHRDESASSHNTTARRCETMWSAAHDVQH
jgi:hypothetical protein